MPGQRHAFPARGGFDWRAAGAWVKQHIPETLVAGLFVIGLTMRLAGVGYGAPLVVHPDEPVVVGAVIRMMKNGSLAPPVPYHYPTVFYYLLLPAFGLRYVRGLSAGEWTGLGDIQLRTFEFYELARTHSALLGALTIPLLFVAARVMWPGMQGRWAGVLASLFVTFSFIHVRESQNAMTDAALVFFLVVAFVAILTAVQRRSTKAFAVAGFACGIACATKYSALPIVAGLAAANFVNWNTEWSRVRRLVVSLTAVPVGFFAGYPYALLNWPPFVEHLRWISRSSGSANQNDRLAQVVGYAMESGFGWLFTLALGIALIRAVYRRRSQELLAVTIIVAAVVLTVRSAMPFYGRYLLPILPFAALLVGALLVQSAERYLARRGRTFLAGAVAVVALALVWSPAAESFHYIGLRRLRDTRVAAYEYVLREYPPGSIIATEGRHLVLPPDYDQLRWSPLHSRPFEVYVERKVNAVIFSSEEDVSPRHRQAEARDDLRSQLRMVAVFAPRDGLTGPTISVYDGPIE
jgi:4-amino-4-deoxy-L-arabinose transferase-like glycosyltransferase